MEPAHRPHSLPLTSVHSVPVSTSPSHHRQSQIPPCHVHSLPGSSILNEKATQPTPVSNLPGHQHQSPRDHRARPLAIINRPLSSPLPAPVGYSTHSPFVYQSASFHHISQSTDMYRRHQSYTRPRGLRIVNVLKAWTPLILYTITSLAFVLAISLWRTEVFENLDMLSHYLQRDEQYGHAVLFFLIFLTTFPPVPLYSTLIILSGYTFGPWTGAIISYFAALTGALAVFIISRTLLRDIISRWLACTTSIKRVVRAIEKRPKLLFLIRLAPYPYNVMNCLLAASPTLTLRTYTVCTALSLFKVIIHTSLGASIHSFKDFDVPDADGNGDAHHTETSASAVARSWTITGVALCIAIFIYLSIVARRAVDEELEDSVDEEETIAFLSPGAQADADLEAAQPMTESPLRPQQLVPPRHPQVHVLHASNSSQRW